ncbi:Alpha/beta hydrolase [Geodermatophilus pulveris]|uniref:Alpha/beta hydrolase n=1 Tax=Geodermatophilus pulveris TaxID=1564159 RepID=A0A239GGT2_9ACTN|nr:alpha/beta hydrolase [Geodermatophilus pulveris]SNS67264.1 Alpha/beta hydrolase [Geodermatophilus pulveris]
MIDGDVAAMTTWDVEQLRAAVAVLDAVLDRLPVVRHRFDEVTRTVWAGAVWSGPAGLAAAGSLSRLSAAAASAGGDLEDSIGWLRRAASEAAEAQEVARRAAEVADRLRHGASSVAVGAVAAGDPDLAALELQLQDLQDRARQHAADAAAVATRAAEALSGLDAVADLAPTSWRGWTSGLPGRHLVEPPTMPTGAVPEDTAAWWSVLSPAQQWAAIARDPAAVGALPGVPAWARDRANRVLLAQAVATAGGAEHDTAIAVAREVSDREAAGEEVQLLELDVGAGLAALALGDLDTAESVGVLVPGVGTEVADDLDAVAEDADAVADAARAAAPGLAVATVAWLGYRTPPGVVSAAVRPRYARDGGRALDTTLDGLAAARAVAGTPRPHTGVLGHSYGTKVVAAAAAEEGLLAADDVGLLGSPGVPGEADDLEVPEVFQATGADDWIRWPAAVFEALDAPGFQSAPSSPHYGAITLPVDEGAGHSDYYERGSATLTGIGERLAVGDRPG